MSVYGNPDSLPVTEKTKPLPQSFYACGKLASEDYLRIFSNYGIETLALRLFNVYGPGQNLDNMKQGMLSIYLAQALKSDKIIVKGSAERFRDFVYIDDVVEAFSLAYFTKYASFQKYNISNERPVKVKEMIEKIFQGLDYKLPVEYTDNTPGDQFGLYGSSENFKKDFGWKPKTEFDEGLKKMIEWALQQKK